jgi:secreted trypsin-like serine protease
MYGASALPGVLTSLNSYNQYVHRKHTTQQLRKFPRVTLSQSMLA